MSRSGKPGYLSLEDIGYGTVTGFKGANCKHNWFMFFEGISKRKYTDEQLEEMKNETVEYNGQKMPLWKAKDYQSRLERAVKASKRELVVLDEAMKNATTDELKNELKMSFSERSVRLKKQEARLKDFCKQTDLYYDSSRLQVFTQETENGIKNFGKSVSSKAVWMSKKAVDNSVKSGIMKSQGGKIMNINNIDSPIEQRNTGKGNPNAILMFDRPLNNRQKKLLSELTEYDSSIIVKKKNVNMKDLSAMTAATGDEFALFTKGNERIVVRGNSTSVNIDIKKATELNRQGYKWSGHTHPGIGKNCLQASPGDVEILKCFKQKVAYIYNSQGDYLEFEGK